MRNILCPVLMMIALIGCGSEMPPSQTAQQYAQPTARAELNLDGEPVRVISNKTGEEISIAGCTMLGGKATATDGALHYRGRYVCRWEGCEVVLFVDTKERDRKPLFQHLDPDSFAVFELRCQDLEPGDHVYSLSVYNAEGMRIGGVRPRTITIP